jgi:hypothetical protein
MNNTLRFFFVFCVLAPRLSAQEFAYNWAWSGGLSDRGAVIVAGVFSNETANVILQAENVRARAMTATSRADIHGVVRFAVSGLVPSTPYTYRVVGSGTQSISGRFTTLPPSGRAASFRLAFGCCNNNPTSVIFRAIAHQKPLFFLQLGDFHYSNIGDNNPRRFRNAMLKNVAGTNQMDLYRSMGIAYVWDDHDFGPNNSNWENPSREAAHLVYRQLVPHYPLVLTHESPERAAPIAQAFTVGRVRFVLSDLRSEHSRETSSLMGSRQREWFFKELLNAAKTHVLIVWVSSVPWISEQGGDNWAGGREERTIIANFVKKHNIPLCIIAGDAHMLAIDDGSHSDYADGGGSPPIPVFHAAALEREGRYKGGPYSHGAKAGTLQFGLLDIEDNGRTLRVTVSGRDGSDGIGDTIAIATQDGDTPLQYSFTLPRTGDTR